MVPPTRNKQEKDIIEIKQIVQETIKELFADNDFVQMVMKKINDKIERNLQKLDDKIQSNEEKTKTIMLKLDNLEQNQKANNLCIYGIQENQNENLEQTLSQIFKEKMNININSEELENCYRVGQQIENADKVRPVIVKYKHYNTKLTILRNCKKLKNSHIFIMEDLTKNRLELLQEAKTKYGKKNVWSSNGHIYTKMDGRNKQIRTREDIA